MKIKLIVAVDAEFGIGKDNDLPWHLPADMKFFKEQTSGHVVITGRKNYESIPEKYRPLPNRLNIVLSRNINYSAPGGLVFSSLGIALQELLNKNIPEALNREVYIIGGGQIFKQALEEERVDEMYITHINESFNADVFFPAFDSGKWNSEIVMEHPGDDKNKYSFIIRKYTKK